MKSSEIQRTRTWAARRLVGLALRLDPFTPVGALQPGGGWRISLGGVPLAEVNISDAQVIR